MLKRLRLKKLLSVFAMVSLALWVITPWCPTMYGTDSSSGDTSSSGQIVYRDADSLDTFLTSDQFLFKTYGWPLLSPTDFHAADPRITKDLEGRSKSIGRHETDLEITVVDTIIAGYLKSRYILVYVRPTFRYLGTLTPFVVPIRENENGSYEWVDSVELYLANHQSDMTRSRRITESDFASSGRIFDCSDSVLVKMAADIITIVSSYRPIIFLSSIDDVLEYSNSVSDEAFWERLGAKDTIRTLLSSQALFNVSSNDYLRCCYDNVRFTPADFGSLVDEIHEPHIRQTGTVHKTIVWWTWSPDCGVFIRWSIVISESGSFRVIPEIKAFYLGFNFFYA